MMHRRSFLAAGASAAFAPGITSDRILGAALGRPAPPALGYIPARVTPGASVRLCATPTRASAPAARSIRFEAVHVPADGVNVALELVRETVAGPIGVTLWAMRADLVRSVGAPVEIQTPPDAELRLRLLVDGRAHELSVRAPRADGRGSSIIAAPLKPGVGAPIWRLWSARFDGRARLARVRRPLGLDAAGDGRLLIAITPAHPTL